MDNHYSHYIERYFNMINNNINYKFGIQHVMKNKMIVMKLLLIIQMVSKYNNSFYNNYFAKNFTFFDTISRKTSKYPERTSNITLVLSTST